MAIKKNVTVSKALQMVQKTSEKLGIGAMLLGLAYGALWSTSSLSSYTSPKIESQNRLEILLEEEKKKLKCTKDIKAELFGSPIPHGIKKENGTYEIKLNGNLATESILKHELYHICDGHTDSRYSFLKYHFWYEPQAMMYETFGLEF